MTATACAPTARTSRAALKVADAAGAPGWRAAPARTRARRLVGMFFPPRVPAAESAISWLSADPVFRPVRPVGPLCTSHCPSAGREVPA